MATPHIESKIEDISNIVLMPGDPNRAKYIADNYLTNVKLINKVRGMLAYTGEYKNKKITIFPSGMGIPSMGIYSYELFKEYNVDYIIRIGTIGAYDEKLQLGDIVIADKAYTDSSFAKIQSNYKENYLDSNKELNQSIIETAEENNIPYINGTIFLLSIVIIPYLLFFWQLNKLLMVSFLSTAYKFWYKQETISLPCVSIIPYISFFFTFIHPMSLFSKIPYQSSS